MTKARTDGEGEVDRGSCISALAQPESERLDIKVGTVCNNNCVFCKEADRAGRQKSNSAMTRDLIAAILEQNRGAREVCFSSGEPTTRPDLVELVALAKRLGYPVISLQTNGRRLSHLPFTTALWRAGLNKVCISIHGHTRKLHDGLTRTPGSFEQSVAGLQNLARFKPHGMAINSSTVVNRRNVRLLLPIYRFLRERGVERVVLNVLCPAGRGETYFEQLFPRYTEIAAEFRRFCKECGEERPWAFLCDIPLCVTEGIPGFNRGYVEPNRHFAVAERAAPQVAARPERAQKVGGVDLVMVRREDLCDVGQQKRAACAACRYCDSCGGVWQNYTKRFGWDEFVPVRAPGA